MSVNGHEVDTPSSEDAWVTYAMLPGVYEYAPYAGIPWVEQTTDDLTVLPGFETSFEFDTSAAPSQEFIDEVDAQIDAYLDTCMSSTELEPEDCPNAGWAFGDVRNVSWELTEPPTVDYSYFTPTFPMDLNVEGGSAKVTYEEDVSWTGQPDWEAAKETVDLYLTVSVDLAGDDLVVTTSTW